MTDAVEDKTGTTGSDDSNRTVRAAKGGSAGGGKNYVKIVVRDGEPGRDFRVRCVADGQEFYPTTFTDGIRNRERDDRFGNPLVLDANGDSDAEIACSWGRSGSQVWISTDAWGNSTRITW